MVEGDARALPQRGVTYLPWGGQMLESRQELAPHYAVMGMTSSGKTLTIRMLMRGALVARRLGGPNRLRHRAIVFDPKGDFFPLLVGMGVPEAAIVPLHAFDARSYIWDLSQDVDTASAARQLAAILVPREPNATQPFFANAAADLMAGVINTLRIKAEHQWSLNDLLEATSEATRLQQVLELTAEGKELHALYFGSNQRTAADILATLRTKLAPLQSVARIWGRLFKDETRRLSLTEWALAKEPRLLLVGTDDTNAESLDPINRALLKRASQLVTGRRDEDPADETWFFLDEARWLGELDGLQGLLLKGRSKGAHVVLGFQDIQGLRHVYGEFQADELIGQCGNIAVFKLASPATMEWAAQYFGKYRDFVRSFGQSWGSQSSTTSTQDSIQEIPSILAQEFRLLRIPEVGLGIDGAFTTSAHAWRGTVSEEFVQEHLALADKDTLTFKPRMPSEQDRLPWDAEDVKRLGLPPTAQAAIDTGVTKAPVRKIDP